MSRIRRNNPKTMSVKSKRIHLIERDHKNRLTKLAEDKLWETGYWDMPESMAKKLLEGSLLLHEKPKSLSFFGGIILNYRVQAEGKWKGRILFTFEFQADHRGVMADPGGWRSDMKIVVKS
jgi:hypothetical protein